ncbi:MAG TPA: amidase [Nitrolancea sp.]|nr:amidase [Nitrolancea sp.]
MSPDDRRLNFATIRELGRMLRSGETTPTALAEHFIGRLETVGRELNAVVTVTRDRAMREARLAEDELVAGYDRGPLHGIPYGAKDLLATAGIPTSWGAEPLRDQVFADDATAVKRLREAGAVLVAKVAMIEMAGGMGYSQPTASLTGPPRNPWNRDSWTGGSSSGSGATVAAGAVPFAIGSETGGSILSPSSYCGLSGLRPTYGRISRHGAMALCWTLDKLGPMCHTADDAGLVLQALAGYDPADYSTLRETYQYAPEHALTGGFRLGILREGLETVQPEVRENFEAACDALSSVATLEEFSLPDYPYGDVYAIVLSAEGAAAFENLIDGGVISGLTAPEDRLGGYAGSTITAVEYLRAMRVRRQINDDVDARLSRYDAILHPSGNTVASPIGVNFEEYARPWSRRNVLTSLGNLSGFPAISVANGFGERGLPTGMQIAGRSGTENAILAVASAYQRLTDWHERHPDA